MPASRCASSGSPGCAGSSRTRVERSGSSRSAGATCPSTAPRSARAPPPACRASPSSFSRRRGGDDAELRAYRARRRAELVEGVYVASLSFRTVTYKALCAATQLASFYPDLRDPDWAAAWAIFHQRFSTNTEPSWERAQPFRLLCHNGEINTIEGNVAWMEAREQARGLDAALAPALDRSGSDSALLDNALELLVRSEVDVTEALSQLVPPAWQNDPRGRDEERAMRRYHAMLVEPWDGPAGLVFTDGLVCGAKLDRNGLRPLRDRGRATTGSSWSAPRRVPFRSRRGRGSGAPGSGPASCSRSTRVHGLRFDGELTSDLARRRPYGEWVEDTLRAGVQGAPAPEPTAACSRVTRSTATRARS